MKNNRVIVLLKSLNKREFNRFLLFVESPFFNQSSKLIRLSRYLSKHSPEFPADKIEKKVLFAQIYGKNIPFEDQKIHDHLSQLLRLFEGFISHQQFKEDETHSELYLLEGLKNRGLEKQFQRVYRRLESNLENEYNHNAAYFLNQYHMLEVKAEFHDQHQKRGKHHNFSQILISLKSHYLSSSLQYACEILNRSRIAKTDIAFNKQLIEEIKLQLEEENNPYIANPQISIYYRILLNLQEPENLEHYEELKRLLSVHAGTLDKSEAKVMYAYAQNYCIGQVNKGNTQFYEELFELYKGLLAGDLLSTDTGILPHEHYKNITTLGLMLKQYDWVYNFLEVYKNHLHESVQENAHSYNLANYYYETEQHPRAMRLLQQVEFTDVYYNVSARATLLKIFFESGDYDSIKYVSQAFLAYIKRNKHIASSHYKRHSNFLLMIRKLVRIHDKKHRLSNREFQEELALVKQELKSLKEVSYRSWINSQIDLLQSRVSKLTA